MEFNQILELIDHVSASELTAFTYETADLTLSMEHGKPQVIQGVMGETVENIPAAGMAGGKDATETEEELDLNYMIGAPAKQEVRYAMSNSLGFGGHNGTLLVKKYEED